MEHAGEDDTMCLSVLVLVPDCVCLCFVCAYEGGGVGGEG